MKLISPQRSEGSSKYSCSNLTECLERNVLGYLSLGKSDTIARFKPDRIKCGPKLKLKDCSVYFGNWFSRGSLVWFAEVGDKTYMMPPLVWWCRDGGKPVEVTGVSPRGEVDDLNSWLEMQNCNTGIALSGDGKYSLLTPNGARFLVGDFSIGSFAVNNIMLTDMLYLRPVLWTLARDYTDYVLLSLLKLLKLEDKVSVVDAGAYYFVFSVGQKTWLVYKPSLAMLPSSVGMYADLVNCNQLGYVVWFDSHDYLFRDTYRTIEATEEASVVYANCSWGDLGYVFADTWEYVTKPPSFKDSKSKRSIQTMPVTYKSFTVVFLDSCPTDQDVEVIGAFGRVKMPNRVDFSLSGEYKKMNGDKIGGVVCVDSLFMPINLDG